MAPNTRESWRFVTRPTWRWPPLDLPIPLRIFPASWARAIGPSQRDSAASWSRDARSHVRQADDGFIFDVFGVGILLPASHSSKHASRCFLAGPSTERICSGSQWRTEPRQRGHAEETMHVGSLAMHGDELLSRAAVRRPSSMRRPRQLTTLVSAGHPYAMHASANRRRRRCRPEAWLLMWRS
jgi:hypothetical protein